MSATTVAARPAARPRSRATGPRHERAISARLGKVTGQVSGVMAMYADGRYCIDVLDQLSAANAAIDGVALLVLDEHIQACVRDAIGAGDADEKIAELVAAVRRYVRAR